MTTLLKGCGYILTIFLIVTLTACALEVSDSKDAVNGTGDDIVKLAFPIENGASAPGYDGLVRLGSNFLVPDGKWHWFCSGVLLNNGVIATARHCVEGGIYYNGYYTKDFFSDPTALWIGHKISSSQSTGTFADQIIMSKELDIALIALHQPFAMYNRSTGQLSTTDYNRPIDSRSTSSMAGTYMLCAGMGGTGGNTDMLGGDITADIFLVNGPDAYPGTFLVNLNGSFVGGKIVAGDSGGPCLYLNGQSNIDQLPVSGIASGPVIPYQQYHSLSTAFNDYGWDY
jgi:hypothetical protein